MTTTNVLPSEGCLRLAQIIGPKEISQVDADYNKNNTSKTKTYRHRRPRPGIPPIIPVSKSQWYAGIKAGIYPAPIHLGRTSVWRVEDIRALLQRSTS